MFTSVCVCDMTASHVKATESASHKLKNARERASQCTYTIDQTQLVDPTSHATFLIQKISVLSNIQ